ncbi:MULTISPECIES: hypothetical protein [Cyanophyceae]|uniref:Glycosyltransferase n=1 Tax=Nodularia spumigena CENA596 TaxID=1819295 RepID=A0A166KDK3_NODSP|nr:MULTISPECIES: hypothetical protein [Cyanophyceae]KZL50957.1 hypothetical protein A2T98_04655 [Nodularia spumigena CENA596]MDB9304051.1 hypothetical protein [Nodularia spumigena CS-591/12]MDB9316906.1 hypothetical protein [Nodularia spumigena CS-590/01A]MDB9327881.1 hypothetical protein [Nodularia spumigena CS-590/02]MDB9333511.1 hypothetical protein [Nodularia spumigena CS-590/01]
MAILLTTLYTSCKPERAEEFLTCLHRNLAHPYIEAVKVFLEIKDQDTDYGYLNGFSHEKLEIIPVHHRSTYAELIAVANNWGTDQVAIIVNGDIYFDENSALERSAEITTGEFWTLSRYEPTPDGGWKLFHIATAGAHDCWIFRTPLPAFKNNYQLGIQGCDLFMAQRAIEAGFKVLNPCFTILARHLHQVAGVRNHKLDPIRKINYWHDPEYAPLGTQTYSPQPSSLERRATLSRRSPMYIGMSLIGRWLLPIYRFEPLKNRLDALRGHGRTHKVKSK